MIVSRKSKCDNKNFAPFISLTSLFRAALLVLPTAFLYASSGNMGGEDNRLILFFDFHVTFQAFMVSYM